MTDTLAAILVAAGPGSRLGAAQPKAFVPLAGRPLLLHAAHALAAGPRLSTLVVVAPAALVDDARALLAERHPGNAPVTVVPGGAERRDSVAAGLAAVGDATFVAVHDAARPFVSAAEIEAVVAAARTHDAAVLAVPASDTVKQVDADGRVVATLPRASLWLAQTPQVFRTALLRRAHAAVPRDSPATDDAALVEALGVAVHVVPGRPDNRKITTPEDLAWAEWMVGRWPLADSR